MTQSRNGGRVGAWALLGVAIAALAGLEAAACAAAPANPSAPDATNPGPSLELPDDPAKALVVRVCSMCHPIGVVVAQRHTPDEWDTLIDLMVSRGAQASEQEQNQIYDYLVRHFSKTAGPAH